jgi:hypothetical protein
MKTRTFLGLIVAAVYFAEMASCPAQETTRDGLATVQSKKGTVEYKDGEQPWKKLKKNSKLNPGVVVRTGANSQADINVNGFASVVRLMPETTLQLQKMTVTGPLREGDRDTLIELKNGVIFGSVKKISADSSYEIHTRHGTAKIRSGAFEIEAKTNSAGSVTFTSVAGQVICVAEVNRETVTTILASGEKWTPGDGDLRELSKEEIYAKPFGDFLGTILIGCPLQPPPPRTVAEVWHVPRAPAH